MLTMKWIALLAFMLAANAAVAAEMSVDGSGAVVLAALVGNQSKTLSPTDRVALTRLLAGGVTKFPAEQTIMVTADKIDCRASNVDILEHSCTLTFGTRQRRRLQVRSRTVRDAQTCALIRVQFEPIGGWGRLRPRNGRTNAT
jgi:hypothetical protein